jgi:hypothetical protein
MYTTDTHKQYILKLFNEKLKVFTKKMAHKIYFIKNLVSCSPSLKLEKCVGNTCVTHKHLWKYFCNNIELMLILVQIAKDKASVSNIISSVIT